MTPLARLLSERNLRDPKTDKLSSSFNFHGDDGRNRKRDRDTRDTDTRERQRHTRDKDTRETKSQERQRHNRDTACLYISMLMYKHALSLLCILCLCLSCVSVSLVHYGSVD